MAQFVPATFTYFLLVVALLANKLMLDQYTVNNKSQLICEIALRVLNFKPNERHTRPAKSTSLVGM
jgi:hypothetical protein